MDVYPLPCFIKILFACRITFYSYLPSGLSFFRTGGRKWKKLISSISSAEDLEESGINGI